MDWERQAISGASFASPGEEPTAPDLWPAKVSWPTVPRLGDKVAAEEIPRKAVRRTAQVGPVAAVPSSGRWQKRGAQGCWRITWPCGLYGLPSGQK